jgi:putative transcriptional regulator
MDATTHRPTLLPAEPTPFARVVRPPALGKGVFLVASRNLKERTFAQTVVLLVHHDEDGAMGVIINRPTTLPLSALLPSIAALAGRDDRVFFGGPVGRQRLLLLVRSATELRQAESVFEDVYVSASEQTLRELLGRADSDDVFYAYVGYAGWAPHQLEQELERGDWYIAAADANLVFSAEPATIWPQLIKQHTGQWVRYSDKQHRVALGRRSEIYPPMQLSLVQDDPLLRRAGYRQRATGSPMRAVNYWNNRMEMQL